MRACVVSWEFGGTHFIFVLNLGVSHRSLESLTDYDCRKLACCCHRHSSCTGPTEFTYTTRSPPSSVGWTVNMYLS